jgi:threonine aldolase
MRKAIAEAVVGDDVFQDDPTVNRLESLAAEMTGMEASIFVPSGTMGNEVAILCHTERGDEAIIEFDSHIYNYETAGPAVLAGVQLAPIKTERGMFSVKDIELAIRPHDDHEPVTRLVCLENTHNRKGGVIHSTNAMKAITGLAKRRGLKTHLDGARVFNAAVGAGIPASEICTLCDSVMFCLSKGLGAPIGSILAGSADFIRKARRYRKLLGGGMRQVGIVASAGIYALENNVERLADDHVRARRLAEAVSAMPGLAVDLDRVQTNIVVIDFAESGISPEDGTNMLENHGVLVIPFGGTTVRAVTHLDIDDEDIEKAISAFDKVFAHN